VLDLDSVADVAVLVDGADEVDDALMLVKMSAQPLRERRYLRCWCGEIVRVRSRLVQARIATRIISTTDRGDPDGQTIHFPSDH
jgi:hypothetical protein